MSESDERIAVARDHLTGKLAELHRRQTAVVTALSPLRHLANPWLGVGLAVLVGYRLGRPALGAVAAPVELRRTVVDPPSFVRSIVRATAVVAAEMVVRRAITRWIERTDG
jgi:hypothetical protein